MSELVGDCVLALAMVESTNNPESWGDYTGGGSPEPATIKPGQTRGPFGLPQAMGRWQIHADRLVYETGKLHIGPKAGETYDSWVERIVTQIFFENLLGRSAVSIAMYWHVGHWVLIDDKEWDDAYAGKFILALAKVQASR